MRGKDLLECMEQIDDALVEEALEPAALSHFSIPRFSVPRLTGGAANWGVAAACAVMLGISAAALWSHQNMKEARIESQYTDTAAPQMVTDFAAAADSGNADGAAAGAQHDAMTAGAGENTEGSAAAGGAETVRQSSAEDTAPSKDSAVETAKAKEELKEQIDGADRVEAESLSYTVISDYYGAKDDSIYDYPVPEKGEFFCYHYLQETMKYYAALEDAGVTQESSVNTSENTGSPIYAYDVVMDIYGEIEENGEVTRYELGNADRDSEKIEREYRRLIDLGYAVRLSEDFQLTGTFTKVELDTFQASPEYGYTFRFASEY